MNADVVTTLWGDRIQLSKSANERTAIEMINASSSAACAQWVILCESLAGGFSSPLMTAGRERGALFRVNLDVVITRDAQTAVLLHYVTAAQTADIATRAIVETLRAAVTKSRVTRTEWRSTHLRFNTRRAVLPAPTKPSTWTTSAVDPWLSISAAELPPIPFQVYAPVLKSLSAQLSLQSMIGCDGVDSS